MRPFERWLLLVSAGATALTGIAYGWMRYALEPANEWDVIHHPLEPWVLKAHILVAPFLVFAVGMVATSHVWRHFAAGVRSGRRTGVLAMGSFLPMVVSGYLIQSLTHPGWLRAAVVLHVAASGLFVGALAGHVPRFLARRRGRGGAVRSGPRRWAGARGPSRPGVSAATAPRSVAGRERP